MLRAKRLNTAGDTIVEVIIVLAVLGLAIGISYSTANRSLLNARQAQENSQATSLVQSQVEALTTMTTNTGANDIYRAGNFCVSQTAPYSVQSGGACVVGSVPYTLSVNYTNTVTDPDKFTVTATWADVLGQGNDTVTMDYRLHKPTSLAPVGGGGGGGGGPFTIALIGSPTCTPGVPTGTYSASIIINGAKPGDTISVKVVNGFTLYGGNTASFIADSNGNVSGTISGRYNSSGQWFADATDNSSSPPLDSKVDICP